MRQRTDTWTVARDSRPRVSTSAHGPESLKTGQPLPEVLLLTSRNVASTILIG